MKEVENSNLSQQREGYENREGGVPFDTRIFIITLKKRLPLIFLTGVGFFLIAALAAKHFIEDKWEARAIIVRHQKNITEQAEASYLYQQFSSKTVLETIKLRKNLETVISGLNLEMSPSALASAIGIRKGRKSNIIHLIVRTGDREKAHLIANKMADVFIDSFVPIQDNSVRKILHFYRQQKKVILAKMKEEDELAESLRELRDIKNKIVANKRRIANLGGVRSREKRSELEKLLEKYSETNPRIVNLKKEIALLERQEVSEIRRQREALLAQNERLRALLEKEKKLAKAEEAYKKLLEKQGKKSHYLDLLHKTEEKIIEAKIALASNIRDFEIIERAKPPEKPAKSYRWLVALVGGFLGFSFSLIFHSLREIFDFRVKSSFDYRGLDALSLVGQIPTKGDVNELEFYRRFQAFFHHVQETGDMEKPASVIFTSDVAGAGTGFLVRETLKFLKSQSKRVLLIRCMEHISLEDLPYAVNDILFRRNSNVFVKVTRPLDDSIDVSFLKTDASTITQVLEGRSVKWFLENLKEYEYVIWQFYPLSFNIQQAVTVMRQCDLTVLISRFRHSSSDYLRNINMFLENRGVERVVSVINRVEKDYMEKTV